MPRKKYCIHCGTARESYYERYDYGSDDQCWYCERYTLEEREFQTLQNCQASGCHSRIYEGNYCSEHRSSSSLN